MSRPSQDGRELKRLLAQYVILETLVARRKTGVN